MASSSQGSPDEALILVNDWKIILPDLGIELPPNSHGVMQSEDRWSDCGVVLHMKPRWRGARCSCLLEPGPKTGSSHVVGRDEESSHNADDAGNNGDCRQNANDAEKVGGSHRADDTGKDGDIHDADDAGKDDECHDADDVGRILMMHGRGRMLWIAAQSSFRFGSYLAVKQHKHFFVDCQANQYDVVCIWQINVVFGVLETEMLC
ncbi:hypothetical protein L484_014348 [Morus notabilis]|uniref:Uncharacterized protein n=1 Tax=Morus notabilis TaxID=981085 RepID=W9S9U9_9ROSA|nr:hypothetical protein L484_014348 [Morus notabilis]